MAQSQEEITPFSLRFQRGFEGSGFQISSSPTLILELTADKNASLTESYKLKVNSRSKAAVGKEEDNGITSSGFDSSHGSVTGSDLKEMGILQALSKLESLPNGGHEKDTYEQGVQIYYSRPPSYEWWNGPAPGCSIEPETYKANSSSPSSEDREVFVSIVKTLEKLLSKATKGTGAGSMGSKEVEPDTAFED
ncbi:hypothetical protein CBS101457_006391 [Exobasidium rhododendri]|nr:hypothetical protein CBS101457_006391 [Exobasidium rhododendri]